MRLPKTTMRYDEFNVRLAFITLTYKNITLTPGQVVAIIFGSIVFGLAIVALLLWALVYNIIDLVNNGPTGWNILWIVLSGLALLSSVRGGK